MAGNGDLSDVSLSPLTRSYQDCMARKDRAGGLRLKWPRAAMFGFSGPEDLFPDNYGRKLLLEGGLSWKKKKNISM